MIWSVDAFIFLFHGVIYLLREGPALSDNFRGFTTRLMGAWGGQAGPILYTSLSVASFIALLYFRRAFAQAAVGWAILNIALFAGGWSMTAPEFRKIIVKEDNVPITMLIFTVGFFTWLAVHKMVTNDERIAKGEPPAETLSLAPLASPFSLYICFTDRMPIIKVIRSGTFHSASSQTRLSVGVTNFSANYNICYGCTAQGFCTGLRAVVKKGLGRVMPAELAG